MTLSRSINSVQLSILKTPVLGSSIMVRSLRTDSQHRALVHMYRRERGLDTVQ